MDLKAARRKYYNQKKGAERRGIGWELTFREWLDWWGEDLARRGAGFDKLQMQRVADVGPYALGNIRKGLPRQNSRTYSAALQNRKVAAAAMEHRAAMDAAPVRAADLDPEDDSIAGFFARDSHPHPKRGVWEC